MSIVLLLALWALPATLSNPQVIPAGTILPVRLDTALTPRKCKPGEPIHARLMQAVRLPDGRTIRAGAKVAGHVIRISGPDDAEGGEIAFRFDRMKTSRTTIPVTVSLRALASFMEIEDARIPAMGPDRGTSEEDYTTQQVGGDVVYRGGGPVMSRGRVVGVPVPDGVLVRPLANPEGGCRGAIYGNDHPQALWLFAADACGTYGLPHVTIRHAGRSAPIGEIVLRAGKGHLNVRGGAGMLLRVIQEGDQAE